MSILNIGLQFTGLAKRELQDKDLEQKLKRRNNMKQIRELAIREDNLKEEMKQFIQPVQDLVENVIKRLHLKEEYFDVFNPTTDSDLDEMWNELKAIDPTVS